jgi:hypothetical protein
MYMKKSRPAEPGSTLPPSSKKSPDTVIDAIHKKVVNSAALNGGFDTLLYKIDKIEQSQGQLVSKVDKIHDAIYDPNDGMFAKLAEHKLESEVKLNEINKSITEINAWKSHREKESVKDDEVTDKAIAKISSLETTVTSLVKSKENVWGVLKWVLAALGGGIVTLLMSWLQGKLK